jgi:beta-lactamase class A
MLKLFDRLENDPDDTLDYHKQLTWHPDTVDYPADDGIMCSYETGRTISLDKVISLMITYSDNHASLWCQKLAGGGAAINAWLEVNGYDQTRVNSRTPGRMGDWEVYGWGQTTPREMAELLVMIREGRAVNPQASAEMYRVLSKIYWDDEALSAIPMTIQAASKQGAVSASRSEVVLVNAPHGDYVFCVITKNQKDTGWGEDNPGFVLLRDISRILWEHFEGD